MYISIWDEADHERLKTKSYNTFNAYSAATILEQLCTTNLQFVFEIINGTLAHLCGQNVRFQKKINSSVNTYGIIHTRRKDGYYFSSIGNHEGVTIGKE